MTMEGKGKPLLLLTDSNICFHVGHSNSLRLKSRMIYLGPWRETGWVTAQ